MGYVHQQCELPNPPTPRNEGHWLKNKNKRENVFGKAPTIHVYKLDSRAILLNYGYALSKCLETHRVQAVHCCTIEDKYPIRV